MVTFHHSRLSRGNISPQQTLLWYSLVVPFHHSRLSCGTISSQQTLFVFTLCVILPTIYTVLLIGIPLWKCVNKLSLDNVPAWGQHTSLAQHTRPDRVLPSTMGPFGWQAVSNEPQLHANMVNQDKRHKRCLWGRFKKTVTIQEVCVGRGSKLWLNIPSSNCCQTQPCQSRPRHLSQKRELNSKPFTTKSPR